MAQREPPPALAPGATQAVAVAFPGAARQAGREGGREGEGEGGVFPSPPPRPAARPPPPGRNQVLGRAGALLLPHRAGSGTWSPGSRRGPSGRVPLAAWAGPSRAGAGGAGPRGGGSVSRLRRLWGRLVPLAAPHGAMQLQWEGEETHPPRSAAAFVTAQPGAPPGPTRGSSASAGARRRDQMEPEGKAALRRAAPGPAACPGGCPGGGTPAAPGPPASRPRGEVSVRAPRPPAEFCPQRRLGATGGRGEPGRGCWRRGDPRGLCGGRPVPGPARLQVCEGRRGSAARPGAALPPSVRPLPSPIDGRCPARSRRLRPAPGPSSARSSPPALAPPRGAGRGGGTGRSGAAGPRGSGYRP